MTQTLSNGTMELEIQFANFFTKTV